MGGDRVAVVTIVHRRHEHLERHLWGLRRQTRRPDLLVVVAMDDPDIEELVRARWPGPAAGGGTPPVLVPAMDRVGSSLPLAAARNLGVHAAEAAGASHLVLLDVDCIASTGLVERYATLLARPDAPRLQVLAGEVAYLPPPPTGRDYRELDLDALSSPHPGRPTLGADETLVADDVRLFWSLSFATTVRTWRTIGGFDPAYVGYGAEDTDFGQRLAAAGGTLTWVGGARAHHQHHPTSDPPTQHLTDIVANANRFARRWGWWPMESWLEKFARLGLARRRPDGVWVVQ
ncbi:glycosyltransferase family 2 protein [Intrasporangium sp. YIM S08009]|uniref:glycosyltransferase family 2 protein n=1 Tax=Intrasporangium zincisolvens TaxID=3080018 RepID=UPI002B06235D|nr:galactosyltransferase-related protein [Intrasporangium sp. YIM S08009]